MQTRSMTRRAGTPHDLEAFNSYADDILAADNNVSEAWLKSKDLPKIRELTDSLVFEAHQRNLIESDFLHHRDRHSQVALTV